MTGDIGEIFNAMRQDRKDRHCQNKIDNVSAIIASGIKCVFKDEVILFREHGKPHVDYYPSTNRWKVIRKPNGVMMSGNAFKFLRWYENQ